MENLKQLKSTLENQIKAAKEYLQVSQNMFELGENMSEKEVEEVGEHPEIRPLLEEVYNLSNKISEIL